MLGITANFDIIGQQFIDETFEETDLANTLQEVPRIFTNIIPIILTVPFFIFARMEHIYYFLNCCTYIVRAY